MDGTWIGVASYQLFLHWSTLLLLSGLLSLQPVLSGTTTVSTATLVTKTLVTKVTVTQSQNVLATSPGTTSIAASTAKPTQIVSTNRSTTKSSRTLDTTGTSVTSHAASMTSGTNQTGTTSSSEPQSLVASTTAETTTSSTVATPATTQGIKSSELLASSESPTTLSPASTASTTATPTTILRTLTATQINSTSPSTVQVSPSPVQVSMAPRTSSDNQGTQTRATSGPTTVGSTMRTFTSQATTAVNKAMSKQIIASLSAETTFIATQSRVTSANPTQSPSLATNATSTTLSQTASTPTTSTSTPTTSTSTPTTTSTTTTLTSSPTTTLAPTSTTTTTSTPTTLPSTPTTSTPTTSTSTPTVASPTSISPTMTTPTTATIPEGSTAVTTGTQLSSFGTDISMKTSAATTASATMPVSSSENTNKASLSVTSSTTPAMNQGNSSATPTAATTVTPAMNTTLATNQTETTQASTSASGRRTPTHLTSTGTSNTSTSTMIGTQPSTTQPQRSSRATTRRTPTTRSVSSSTSQTTPSVAMSNLPSTAGPPVGQAGGGKNLVPVIGGAIAGVVVITLVVILVILLWKRYRCSGPDKEDSSLLQSVRRLETVEYTKGVTNLSMTNFESGTVDNPDTYTALFQFKGTNADELDLEPHDTVQVIERSDSGWWRGSGADGRVGWFPAEYVEQRETERHTTVTIVTTPKEATLLATAEQRRQSIVETSMTVEPLNVEEPVQLSMKQLEPVAVIQPSTPIVGESPATSEDVKLIVTEPCPTSEADFDRSQSKYALDSDKLKDKSEVAIGLSAVSVDISAIPSTLHRREEKEPIDVVETKTMDQSLVFVPSGNQPSFDHKSETNDEIQHNVGPAKEAAIATYEAVYDYVPLREDELSLALGDHIAVIEQGADGWWRGTKSGGQIGWFPCNYVGSVGQSDAAVSETTACLEASDSALGSMTDEEEGTEYRAIYPYVAQRDDEVTFNEGDVVLVFETAKTGWWRGSVSHRHGWFPGNYVEPIITDEIADDESRSRPQSVVMDTSAVSQEHLAGTELEDAVRHQHALGFLGELANAMGKRPKEEVQPKETNFSKGLAASQEKDPPTASQPTVTEQLIPQQVPKPQRKAPAPTLRQEKQPTVNVSQNSITAVPASSDVNTSSLVADSSTADTTKSREPLVSSTATVTTDSALAAGSKATTVAQSLMKPKDEGLVVVPTSRPILPKRTVRSKLVKLPQGGAVKKRTQATTSRPPPPNRSLPPPPTRELPPRPLVKQEQAAAAKETIGGKRKLAPAAPILMNMARPPAGLKPPVPTRRNPPSQANKKIPGQSLQPSTTVVERTVSQEERTDGTKPVRPPPPKTSPVVAREQPAIKESVAQSASVETVTSAFIPSNDRPTLSQNLTGIDNTLSEVAILTDKTDMVAQKGPPSVEKQATATDKPSPSLKPIPGQKPSLSPKPVIARKPKPLPQSTSKPAIAKKPQVVAKPPATSKPFPSAGPAMQSNSVSTPTVKEDAKNANRASISPPKSQRLAPPSVSLPPPPSEDSAIPSLSREPDRQMQSGTKAPQPRPQKRPAAGGHAVVAPEPLVRQRHSHTAFKNDDTASQVTSEVEPKHHKTPEPKTVVDTDESSSVVKSSQPKVLFVAPGQEAKPGLLKPLPKKDEPEKKDKKLKSERKRILPTNPSAPQEKPKDPPAKPKPPVIRPPLPAAKLDPLDDSKKAAMSESLQSDATVRPRPAPRRKETTDSTIDQPESQTQTRSRQTSAQEVPPSSSPKVKPLRPAKGPVVKSSGNAPSLKPHLLNSTEKSATKPVAVPRTEPSQASRLQVSNEKPARPSSSQSDSKPKPQRPPPPKSLEPAKQKPPRSQPPKTAVEKKSNPLRKAIATYNAQRSDELTFNEGDLIVEVQPVDEHGWCKGKLTTTGQEGMYPGNFVESA